MLASRGFVSDRRPRGLAGVCRKAEVAIGEHQNRGPSYYEHKNKGEFLLRKTIGKYR